MKTTPILLLLPGIALPGHVQDIQWKIPDRSLSYGLLVALIFIFSTGLSYSQNSSYTPVINNIPSSPEASLLGRFGDIPIGYYTGTAPVSVPIYTIKESGVEIPIVLSYHSSGIKVDDEATWVGLGWNLEPGGAIIQEIRGKEDLMDSNYWPDRYGATAQELTIFMGHMGAIASGFHYSMPQTGDCLKGPYNPQISPSSSCRLGDDSFTIIQALLQGHGQPDIYHYDFAGYSGKFYINPETRKVDFIDKKGDIDIVIPGWIGSEFQVTAPDGTRFYFDAPETTRGASIEVSGKTSKLTKIEFTNGKKIEFSYVDELYSKVFNRSTVLLNDYQGGVITTPENFSDFTLGTKKTLSKITTPDAVISFNLEDRADMDYIGQQNNTKRLKSIEIKPLLGRKIRSFNFSYSYFNPESDYRSKRLRLDAVQETGYTYSNTLPFAHEIADTSKPPYRFEYDTSITMPAKDSYSVDFWGYYNGQLNPVQTLIPDLDFFDYPHLTDYMSNGYTAFSFSYIGANRYTDNTKAGAYLLKKVTYPTGGSTQFEYEPNTFTNQYIPNNADLRASYKDFTCIKNNTTSAPVTDYLKVLPLTKTTTVKLTGSIIHGNPVINLTNPMADFLGITQQIYYNSDIQIARNLNGVYTVLKTWRPNEVSLEAFRANGISWNNQELTIVYEPGASYTMSVHYPNFNYNYSSSSPAMVYANIHYTDTDAIDTSVSTQCGMRVKRIKNYSGDGMVTGNKQINYYEGKLLNHFEPITMIDAMYSNMIYGVNGHFNIDTGFYKRFTISSDDFGTNGGNLTGYGRVEEIELDSTGTDNIGKKVYYYYNNINQTRKGYPNCPYLKNGLLLKEEVFNKASDSLMVKEYNYTNLLPVFHSFSGITITNHSFGNCDWTFGPTITTPESILSFYHKYTYGMYPITSEWNKIGRIRTKEYFNGRILSSTENYIYNSEGNLRTVQTTNSNNEQLKTNYFYAGDTPDDQGIMLSKKMTGIPITTENYNNTDLLFRQDTQYAKDDSTADLVLPKYIFAQKNVGINFQTEKKVTHDLYDNKGNLLQYTPENGVPVSIIWGYGQTVPVAKIENMTYAEISPGLITEIADASGSTTENEDLLLTKLDALRASAIMNKARITTYTYKQLIGVSTITDPKGDRMTYTYDGLGRLKYARDKDGNMVSENRYNYRPQIQQP